MAADLHIHVLTDEFTKDDCILSKCNVMGGKYYNMERYKEYIDRFYDLLERSLATPSISVGEASWLKEALLGDYDTLVLRTAFEVCKIIGEDFPVIDDDLIAKVSKAMNLDGLADADEVIEFLEENKGHEAFTIGW